MRILFISSSLEPGRDGVGDYVRLLAAACARLGHACAILGLSDRHVPEPLASSLEAGGRHILITRLPANLPDSRRLELALAFRREFQPDWISFNLVPYAFQKRGMLHGLVAPFRSLTSGCPLHLMFHELWVGAGRPTPLRFHLVGLLQRRAIRKLLSQLHPKLVTASNPIYAAMLQKLGAHAEVLPLFGNVPIAKTDVSDRAQERLQQIGVTAEDRDDWWIGVFFGALHEQWKPEPFMTHLLRAAAKKHRRVCLLLVGRPGAAGEAIWKNLVVDYGTRAAFLNLGEQPTETISSMLQLADFGIAASPWQLIGKSGTVAAMLDHGLPAIVTRDDFHPYIPASEPPSRDELLHHCDDQLEAKLVTGLAKRPARARVDPIAEQLCVRMQALAPASS